MRMISIIIILLLQNISFCFGQIRPGARQIALAHSDAAMQKNVFALFNNPAGLSDINYIQAGLFYSPSPFGVKELASAYAALIYPSAIGSFSAGFSVYGYDLYRETELYAAYSKTIFQNFSFGFSLSYRGISIKNYGNSSTFLLNAGFSTEVTGDLRLGATAYNITRSSISDYEDQIPTVFNAGLTYFKEAFNINVSVEKELLMNPAFLFGIEIQPVPFCALRFGISTYPSKLTAGAGVNYKLFQFNYAVFTHHDLGLTHQAGIIISLGSVEI